MIHIHTGHFSEDFLHQISMINEKRSPQTIDTLNKRYQEGSMSFLDVDKYYEGKRIKKYVEENKKYFDDVVVLGIGGSALGTKAIFEAFRGQYYNHLSKNQRGGYPRLFVLDNIDPSEIKSLMSILQLEKTLCIIVSKSGTTLETLSQFVFFKNEFQKRGRDYKKHFVIIAGQKTILNITSRDNGLEVFDIPEGIGGRFSVLTNVGLLPLAFVGIKIDDLLAGFSSVKKNLFCSDWEKNSALLTAIIQYYNYDMLSKNITVFFPYSANLTGFGRWYQQLIGESLGKEGQGVTVVNSLGVTDQHSQLQLYCEGPDDKTIMFLECGDFGNDESIWGSTTFGDLMRESKKATQQAITQRGVSSYTLYIDQFNEESFGQLIAILQMQTVILGEFYGVNPFDQPGVECGKMLLKKSLGEIDILKYIFSFSNK